MFRIMLKDMLATVRKKFPACVFYGILLFGGVKITGNYLKGFGVSAVSFFGSGFAEKERCLLSILLMLFIYLTVQELPLRICRGLFVCAAGKKEKVCYLLEQLAVKLVFSFLLLTATGGIFVSGNGWLRAVQLLLWFFTLLNINMKIGIGVRGAREVDEKGYTIYSPAETAVNINWFCFILIQNVLFYTGMLVGYEPENALTAAGILLLLAINGYYAGRYLKPVLKEAMSYENVYRQLPVREYEKCM